MGGGKIVKLKADTKGKDKRSADLGRFSEDPSAVCVT